MWSGDFFLWRVEFFKIGKRDFTFIRDESSATPIKLFAVNCYSLKTMSFRFGNAIFITFEMPGSSYKRPFWKINISLLFCPFASTVHDWGIYLLLTLIYRRWSPEPTQQKQASEGRSIADKWSDQMAGNLLFFWKKHKV